MGGAVNHTAGQQEVTAPEVRKDAWLPESEDERAGWGTDGKGVSGGSILYS